MNYIHTNYYNFLIKKNILDKKKINFKDSFKLMEHELLKLGSRKIIIPTYNYDFIRHKVFNVKKDQSQVGSFTEYFRKKYNQNRTSIPVYSSCSNFKIKNLNKKKRNIDLIGIDSDFNYLIKNNGNIINFEVEFAPTFIIFIEKLNSEKIIYRYSKQIDGFLINGNFKKKICAELFVRPRKLNITYDLKKIKKDLINEKILKVKKKGVYKYDIYNSIKFFEFCNYKLNKDNLYFLDKKSKNELKNNGINFKNKEKIKKFD